RHGPSMASRGPKSSLANFKLTHYLVSDQQTKTERVVSNGQDSNLEWDGEELAGGEGQRHRRLGSNTGGSRNRPLQTRLDAGAGTIVDAQAASDRLARQPHDLVRTSGLEREAGRRAFQCGNQPGAQRIEE